MQTPDLARPAGAALTSKKRQDRAGLARGRVRVCAYQGGVDEIARGNNDADGRRRASLHGLRHIGAWRSAHAHHRYER